MVVGLLLAGSLLAATPAVVPPAESKRERAVVHDIYATDQGQYLVVLRTEREPTRFLPIWVGETEAIAIRMRLDRRNPPRPLTLNLLESVIASSRLKVQHITIDGIRDGIFFSSLRLKQQGRAWDVDARPSDAIGLALGRGAPIYVTQEVLERAAFDPKEVLRDFKAGKNIDAGESFSGYEDTL